MTEEIKDVKIKRSDSFRFIFPMLSDSINDFVDKESLVLALEAIRLKRGTNLPLINCYIADKDIPEYNNHIFVLYKFIGSKEFGIFEQSLTKHPYFVEMYNPTSRHDMFVFGVPVEYQVEYDLFMSERPKIYRRFSDEYKKRVISFLSPMFDIKDITNILYADESRFKDMEKKIGVKIPRDIDNYSIPDITNNETFDKTKYL